MVEAGGKIVDENDGLNGSDEGLKDGEIFEYWLELGVFPGKL